MLPDREAARARVLKDTRLTIEAKITYLAIDERAGDAGEVELTDEQLFRIIRCNERRYRAEISKAMRGSR